MATLLVLSCGREGVVLELDGEKVSASDFAERFEETMGPLPPEAPDSVLVSFAHQLLRQKLLEKEARSGVLRDTVNLSARIAARRRSLIADETYRAVTDTVLIDEKVMGEVFDGLDEEFLLRLISASDSTAVDSIRTALVSGADLDRTCEEIMQPGNRITVRRARFTSIDSPPIWRVARGLGQNELSPLFRIPEGYAILYLEARRPRERGAGEKTIDSFRERYIDVACRLRYEEFTKRTLRLRYGTEPSDENIGTLGSLLQLHNTDVEARLNELKEAGADQEALHLVSIEVPSTDQETGQLPLVTLDGGANYTIVDYLQDSALELTGSRPGGKDLDELRGQVMEKLVTWLAAVDAEESGRTRENRRLDRTLASAEGWEYMRRFHNEEVEKKINVAPEELRSYYDSHHSFYEQHPLFQVAYFKIEEKTGGEALAQWVTESLRAGMSRDSVAAEGKRRSADLHYYPGDLWLGNLGTGLDPTLFSMRVGEVSDPVTVSSGNRYVLCLLGKRTPTYEDALSSGLERSVLQQKRNGRLDEIVGDLKRKYHGTVHEEAAREARRLLAGPAD